MIKISPIFILQCLSIQGQILDLVELVKLGLVVKINSLSVSCQTQFMKDYQFNLPLLFSMFVLNLQDIKKTSMILEQELRKL